MSQKRPPIGSSVRLLETLETEDLSKIPEGTVGIVQDHCKNRELKVEFKLGNTAVEVKVEEKHVKEKIFTVLCIDGGGIRGLIPAVILAYIEQRMKCFMKEQLCVDKAVDQLRIADFFDLIAGTSTGGIIALALTKPDSNGRPEYTAEKLVNLYLKEGEKIFYRPESHRIRSVDGWINKKYPADGIQKVLKTYFGCTTLDQAVTRVLIPTYDMRGARVHLRNNFDCRRGGHPRFFKNYATKDATQGSDTCQQSSKDCTPAKGSDLPDSYMERPLMRDVARATSAAPTYFEPIDLKLQLSNLTLVETLVDGGVFANNPAMCAYADAKCLLQREERRNEQILLVSIGTGNLTGALKAEAAKDWGKLHWIETLITMIFDGASDTVNYQLQQLIPGEENYYRFQPQLTFGQDEMDDASRGNLISLKALADGYIKKKKCALQTISERLVKNRLP